MARREGPLETPGLTQRLSAVSFINNVTDITDITDTWKSGIRWLYWW